LLMATKTVAFEIKRQANPDAPAVWEKFELEWRPGMNVISAMMEIAANPVTAEGHATTPVTYDSNCLEEICGSCAMRINGKARMACSALVDNLEQPIKLEPLSKFPLVRDLQVDRSVLFENLKAVKAWVPVDGTYDLGRDRACFRSSRRSTIRCRIASRAHAAWRFARSSTRRRGLLGRRRLHR
jgi:succinate dehydrogenase / fumarate reductase iron-sulfur subunit